MANLAVNVAGVSFKNPIIPASGVFGYGREYEKLFPLSELGGIATKGTTGQPRPGNPAPRIAETPSGMLNSVGLQNPGIDAFLERELPNLLTKDTIILANIAGSTVEECVSIAEKLDETDVHMIELNISCPNVKKGGAAFGVHCESAEMITAAVRKATADRKAFSQCHQHYRYCQGSGICRCRQRFPHQYPFGHADQYRKSPPDSAEQRRRHVWPCGFSHCCTYGMAGRTGSFHSGNRYGRRVQRYRCH